MNTRVHGPNSTLCTKCESLVSEALSIYLLPPFATRVSLVVFAPLSGGGLPTQYSLVSSYTLAGRKAESYVHLPVSGEARNLV